MFEVSLPLPEWPVWVDLMSIAPSELSEKEEGVISTNWCGWWRKIGRGGSKRSTADIRIGSLGRSEHMNCVLSELDHWSVQNTWGLYYQKWITQLLKFQTYEWFTSRVGSSYTSLERANLLLGMTWHSLELASPLRDLWWLDQNHDPIWHTFEPALVDVGCSRTNTVHTHRNCWVWHNTSRGIEARAHNLVWIDTQISPPRANFWPAHSFSVMDQRSRKHKW